MANQANIVSLSIAAVLLLFWASYYKLRTFEKETLRQFSWWLWVRSRFIHRWEPSEVLFGIFWDTFIATTAVVVALKLANIQEGAAMFYFLIISIVCLAFAIVTRIRIDRERNDTPLDIGKINADFRKHVQNNRRKMEKRINKK